MSQIAVVVEFKTKPGQRDEFLKIIRKHATDTMATEPGCKRFDVMVPQKDADGVWLCEVYADDAAFAAHGAMPRLAQVREQYKDLIENRTINVCTL